MRQTTRVVLAVLMVLAGGALAAADVPAGFMWMAMRTGVSMQARRAFPVCW